MGVISRLALVSLFAWGSAGGVFAEPMPSASPYGPRADLTPSTALHSIPARVGPVVLNLECLNAACSQANFHFGYNGRPWKVESVQCPRSPCDPDLVHWFPRTRLLAIETLTPKGSRLHLMKITRVPSYSVGSFRSQDGIIASSKFGLEETSDHQGSLVDLGSGFLSVDDGAGMVLADPSRTGLSWNEHQRVDDIGALTPSVERTCQDMESWMLRARDALDRRALGDTAGNLDGATVRTDEKAAFDWSTHTPPLGRPEAKDTTTPVLMFGEQPVSSTKNQKSTKTKRVAKAATQTQMPLGDDRGWVRQEAQALPAPTAPEVFLEAASYCSLPLTPTVATEAIRDVPSGRRSNPNFLLIRDSASFWAPSAY